MYSIVRLSAFGVFCFMAGTFAVASLPFAPHDGDEDLPVHGTTCQAKGCAPKAQTSLPHQGAVPKPTVLTDTCSAYNQYDDTAKVRPFDNRGHFINIADRSAYGFSPALAVTKAVIAHKQALDVKEPYFFVVIEHCTKYKPDGAKQVTTQIIRVPWNKNEEEPTVETIRTPAKDGPPSSSVNH